MSPMATGCHTRDMFLPMDEATHPHQFWGWGGDPVPHDLTQGSHLLGGMVMMMAPPPRAAVRFLVLHIRYVAHGKCSVTASCVIRSLESAGTAV